MNLKLLTEKEIKEDGFLSLLIYKSFAHLTHFAAKIGGGTTWATGTTKLKEKPYPRCEGAYEQVVIDEYGRLRTVNMGEHHIGIRPAVAFSEIEKDCIVLGEDHCNLTRVQYGEYPQTKVLDDRNLEEALNKGKLKETSKEYSIPNPTIEHQGDYFNQPWTPRPEIQFIYEDGVNLPGLYFPPGVRKFSLPQHSLFNNLTLDKNEPYKKAKEYISEDGTKYVKVEKGWFKVEPITWRVDKTNNIAITEEIISGGVPICEINDYLKEHLSKDIIPSSEVKKVEEETEEHQSSIIINNINIDKISDLVITNEVVINHENNSVEVITVVHTPKEESTKAKVYKK